MPFRASSQLPDLIYEAAANTSANKSRDPKTSISLRKTAQRRSFASIFKVLSKAFLSTKETLNRTGSDTVR